MRNAILGLALGTLAAAAAGRAARAADVVKLKDGRKIEGRILRQDERKIIMKVTRGHISFEASYLRKDILSIEKEKTPREVYAEKKARLAADDAEGHYLLALWCAEKTLFEEASGMLAAAYRGGGDVLKRKVADQWEKLGEWPKVIEHYEEALRKNPDDGGAESRLAEARKSREAAEEKKRQEESRAAESRRIGEVEKRLAEMRHEHKNLKVPTRFTHTFQKGVGPVSKFNPDWTQDKERRAKKRKTELGEEIKKLEAELKKLRAN